MSNIVSIVIIIAIIIIKKAAKENKANTRKSAELFREKEQKEVRYVEKGQVVTKESKPYDLWKTGNQREALKYLEDRDTIRKGQLNDLMLLGEIYYEMNSFDKASKAFSHALRKSKSSYAYARLGDIAVKNELYKDGIKLYKKALNFKDAPKGYLFHQLGNLYMYIGDDDKSNQYFEKAEVFHSAGQGTKLQTFDYKRKAGKQNNSSAIIIFLGILFLMGIITFFGLLGFQVTTNSVDVEVVEVFEDKVETSEVVETLNVTENRLFGNHNSNILYGGYVLDVYGDTFIVNLDQVLLVDESRGIEKEFFTSESPAYLNYMDETFYFISYADPISLISYDRGKDDFDRLETFSKPKNLLVDKEYLYVIDDLIDQVFYVRSLDNGDDVEYASQGIELISQSEDTLYFLKYDRLCFIEKNGIMNLDSFEESLNYLFEDVDFISVDGDYLFYVSDELLYRYDLVTEENVELFTDIALEIMNLLFIEDQIFISYDIQEPVTDVFDYQGNFLYTLEDYVGNQYANDYLYWY